LALSHLLDNQEERWGGHVTPELGQGVWPGAGREGAVSM
jgi:hypothetical protein